MAGRRQAFHRTPELQRFVLSGVRPTGKQLGTGSYGSVEELEVNGVVCAAKQLHDALVEQGNAGVANIVRKYLQECQVMAELRHPHIVQFLGLCFLEGSALPMLVMERLDSSLDDLLEGAPGLPLALKRSLLADVARGLLYLHTYNPPIVHRDLSARNVLLTSSLVAKISDLGNARIVNLQPGQLARTLTRLPGTMVYMPPEAFDDPPQYGPRLDIFSFGHLTLFTLTQVFPGTLLPHNYADPQNPDHLFARSEVDRRRDYIQSLYRQLPEQHPLVQLVHQCLHNTPARRPSAEELLQQLEAVRAQIEGPYGSQLKKMDVAKVGMMKALREIESLQEEVQQLEELGQAAAMRETEARDIQLQEKDAEIERQQRELQALRVEMNAQLQQKDGQIQQQATELRERSLQLNRQQREVQTLTEDKGRLLAEVESKDAEIDRQRREVQRLAKLSHLQQQAQEKDAEVHWQQRELQALRTQNTSKDEQLAAVQAQLQQLQVETDAGSAQVQQQLREKDAEINRLWRELRDQPTSRDKNVVAMQSPPQNSQCPPDELKLKWRRLADMPRAIEYPQSVTLDTVVYVADRDRRVIHRYDPQTSQQWTELPEYEYWNFTITQVGGQLAVVGGENLYELELSDTVAVYLTSRRSWEPLYPPMNTPRAFPAVSTYHHHLVVAGGSDGSTELANVEILDTSRHHSQWLSATPLPVSCRLMSSAIVDSTLYLLGGSLGKQVLSVSLPALTQTDKPPAQWRTLSNAPLERSTAIAVHGSLLAVGGSHSRQRSSAIHVYDQEKNAWNKVGDLPTEREDCACCLLPSGEILVAGGEDHDDLTSRMDATAVD